MASGFRIFVSAISREPGISGISQNWYFGNGYQAQRFLGSFRLLLPHIITTVFPILLDSNTWRISLTASVTFNGWESRIYRGRIFSRKRRMECSRSGHIHAVLKFRFHRKLPTCRCVTRRIVKGLQSIRAVIIEIAQRSQCLIFQRGTEISNNTMEVFFPPTNRVDYKQVASKSVGMWPVVRRFLTEARDRTQPILSLSSAR